MVEIIHSQHPSYLKLYQGWANQAGVFSLLLLLLFLLIPGIQMFTDQYPSPDFYRVMSMALITNSFFGKLFGSWCLEEQGSSPRFLRITYYLHSFILAIVGTLVFIGLLLPRALGCQPFFKTILPNTTKTNPDELWPACWES